MKNILTAFTLFLIAFNVRGQLMVKNIDQVDKVKNGTTYVIIDDVAPTDFRFDKQSPLEKIMDVFKKYWTINKVEFIKLAELEDHIAPENSYISFVKYPMTGRNYIYYQTRLQFWVYNKKFFNAGKKDKGINQFMEPIATFELMTDFELAILGTDISIQIVPFPIYSRYNWGAGTLKNYLQLFTTHINSGKKKNNRYHQYTHKKDEELQNLKNDTLYIPDYILVNNHPFAGYGNKQKTEPEKLCKRYKGAYKIVSLDELDDLILGNRRIYYLNFSHIQANKYVNVINSETGKIVYSTFKATGWNVNASDLGRINRGVH